jgi:hypothetical protein
MSDELGAEDRAGEGVEHLQAAAKELIEAARAFLDVADDLVRDPKVAEGLLTGLSGLADGARDAAKEAARRAAGADRGADEDDGGVQHIHVS